jgi:Zn-dependent protease
MSEFYYIDSSRVSHREYWWGNPSPLVLVGWLIKWLRVPIPGSSDDPNVDTTLPFVVESLPSEILAKFEPVAADLTALGFGDPVYHTIHDAGTRTTWYWATYRESSGTCFARIHHRVWHQAQKPSRALFPMFFTEFTDGTFLVSSSGKPDMAAPESIQMVRLHKAPTLRLWAAHTDAMEKLKQNRMVAPIHSREEVVAATERHHVLTRDFHLGRGVFRPRTAAEQAKAEAYTKSVAEAQALGHEHAEVIAELDRLQDQKPSWAPAVWILVLSLVGFLAAGAASWDWKFTLLIIPVLLFHELGHWVAMRLFRYRNLRMFFIPFFGAAVTGQNWNVAGWKKALVSLAGPLPGIALGVVLGIASIILKQSWLNQAAILLLITNGFNLIPILPLDGGHVLQDVLFCRNRWLDGVFRIVTIFGLIGVGLLMGAKLLPYLAIPMAIALPATFKLGRITDELRQQPLAPPYPGEDRIPVPTAQAIIGAVKQAFTGSSALSNKVVAQHSLMVFERLNAKPPGVLATLALLMLHGGAVIVTLLMAVLLVVSKHRGLGDFMAAAMRQPQHLYQAGDLQRWPADTMQPQGVRTLIVAEFQKRPGAVAAFSALTNEIAPPMALMRFGDYLILSLPATNDAVREQWYESLQGYSTNLFVALSNAPVGLSLTCIAPSKQITSNVVDSLSGCLNSMGQTSLIPPWSPEAKEAKFPGFRQARADLTLIEQELAKSFSDGTFKQYAKDISAAYRRGATAEVARLSKERDEKIRLLREQAAAQLSNGIPRKVDTELLGLQLRLNNLEITNVPVRKQLQHEIGVKLGLERFPATNSVVGMHGVVMGSASAHGLIVELQWLSFRDVTCGLPELMEWLQAQGCRTFKYNLESGGWGGMDEEDD